MALSSLTVDAGLLPLPARGERVGFASLSFRNLLLKLKLAALPLTQTTARRR